MGYIPLSATDTLVVALGYAFQGSFSAGSNILNGVGFAFTAADVGDVIMVLSGNPNPGFPGFSTTWTTITARNSSSQVQLAASLPLASSPVVNCVLYRPLAGGLETGAMNYIKSGSVQVDTSFTSHSSAQFTVISRDGSLIVPLGMPVLITDTEAGVEYFGGRVSQNDLTNEPGAAGTSATPRLTYSACQCVGWEIILQRRTTGVSDAAAEGDTTLGAANPAGGQFTAVRADQIADYWVKHALFDDGVTENFDTSGPVLPAFSSIAAKVNDAMDQLVNATNSATKQFQWFMSPRRVLNLVTLHTTPAPWNISDVDLSDANVLIQVQNTLTDQNYFNRGIAEINSIAQTFNGNGSATTFTLGQAVPTEDLGIVRITLDGNSQTVGVLGVDSGKQWYYQPGSATITQGTGAVLLSTNVLVVSFPVFVIFAYDDLAAQAAQTAVESGSGIWEAKINLNAMSTVVDAETFVTSMVAQARDFAQQITVMSYKPGLQVGQTIQVNLKDIGLDSNGSPALGAYFLIDSVRITTDENRKLFTITASKDAPIIGDAYNQLKRGLGTAGGVNAHPLAVGLSGAALAAGIGSGGPAGASSAAAAQPQTAVANLIPVRSWIDETGRQPLTNAMNNTEAVPLKYNGYLFYAAACNDGTFQVFKSTDQGRTWAAVDAAHAPADVSSPSLSGMSGSCVFDGGYLLHCATVKPHAGANLAVQSFNLSTELWGAAHASSVPAELICSLHWRANNSTVLITYDRGAVDPSPTRSRFWGVSFNLSTLAFGTAFDIGAALLTASSSATGDVNSTFATGITDSAGRTHFFLSNNAATYFWYQAAELGDVRGSSYFFTKPAAGKIPTWISNSNVVISQTPNGAQRLTIVVVTKE